MWRCRGRDADVRESETRSRRERRRRYCSVIKHVGFRHAHFRVLALSATPGADVAGVQDVVDNLRIAHVEVRTEEDPDVAPHTHARLVERVVCEEGATLRAGLDALQKVANPFLNRLKAGQCLHTSDLAQLRSYTLLKAQVHGGLFLDKHVGHKLCMAAEALRQYPAAAPESSASGRRVFTDLSTSSPRRRRGPSRRTSARRYGTSASSPRPRLYGRPRHLARSPRYGVQGCVEKLQQIARAPRDAEAKREKGEPVPAGDQALCRLAASPSFRQLLESLKTTGEHPKVVKLRELLLDHFRRAAEAGRSSRAMVFTGTRHSVDEIGDALGRCTELRARRPSGASTPVGPGFAVALKTTSPACQRRYRKRVPSQPGSSPRGSRRGDAAAAGWIFRRALAAPPRLPRE